LQRIVPGDRSVAGGVVHGDGELVSLQRIVPGDRSVAGGVVHGDGELVSLQRVVPGDEDSDPDVPVVDPTPEDPTPNIPQALYPTTSDAIPDDVTAPYAVAAVMYDGYLWKGDALGGTIQVKVAKMAKNGTAKVTVTIQLETQKLSFKSVADATGAVTAMSTGGHTLHIFLGRNGLRGQLDSAYMIDGARNLFTSKDKGEKTSAETLAKRLQGVVNVVLPEGRGTLSATIATKGKVKVAGSVGSVKVSAASQLLIGEDACAIPIVITKNTSLAFLIWVDATGALSVNGLAEAVVGRPGALGAGATFRLDASVLAKTLPGLYTDYLPNGLTVSQSEAKWLVASGAKAGKVQLDRKTGAVDATKLGENPSGLKLLYTTKTGTFKGSFKAYVLENGKIKAYSANVAGVLVGDRGYGTATVKKPVASLPVTVE
ncbi:MAG: hypothetical protein MJ240_05875, partial [Kiritimatiellae bacterium]|nr:hypothetical protein [Kiritimatiellia bacterium]